jgi:drug/metabolite transporter (DMT)-like permease
MVGATMMFAGSSAVSKWLVDRYPVGEVLFTRSAVSLIVCAAFLLPRTGLLAFRTGRLHHHALRSVSQAVSQTLLLIAFSMMPLAGALHPTLSASVCNPGIRLHTRERVGLARWPAMLVGFFGVLVVTHPGAGTFQIGALFALGNAVLYGSVTVAVRSMTATESAETLTLYQLMLLTVLFALLLPFGWVSPDPLADMWLVFNGTSNAIGQFWWTRAPHLAPASAVAPFYYTRSSGRAFWRFRHMG